MTEDITHEQSTLDAVVEQSSRPTEPRTRRELLERAAAHAETVQIDVDTEAIEWEISEHAKRRAGACRYDPDTGSITIRLTWRAYQAHGWEAFRETIRHELVHAWEFQHFGESGHGERFRKQAARIDASRHCESFTEGRLELICTNEDCDWRAERHRASKPIKHPDGGYRCGACRGSLLVRHLASGRTWQTHEGYRRAREALGEDW